MTEEHGSFIHPPIPGVHAPMSERSWPLGGSSSGLLRLFHQPCGHQANAANHRFLGAGLDQSGSLVAVMELLGGLGHRPRVKGVPGSRCTGMATSNV